MLQLKHFKHFNRNGIGTRIFFLYGIQNMTLNLFSVETMVINYFTIDLNMFEIKQNIIVN